MQISEELFQQWRDVLIRKSSQRLLELTGDRITDDEAEAAVVAILAEYDRLLEERAVKV